MVSLSNAHAAERPAKTARAPIPPAVDEPKQAARAAGLNHVSPDKPGIKRIRAGKGFRYVGPEGHSITDKIILGRIKRLAIPPAWTDVWICPSGNGHLQAVGLDARRRKQYRYHPRWREVRDETKYTSMLEFAKLLPKIRRRVEHDLKRPGLPREKVLATIIKILETGLIRVGNDEYARENNSYGLTTMLDRHTSIKGSTIRFQFRGKGGKYHKIEIQDRRMAKIVAHCQSIPGQDLFQYIDDDGTPRDIISSDVNEYLREITASDFTAKDFRTWAGTVLAAMALQEFEKFDTRAQAKKNLLRAIEAVAQRLGNTPSICRKCYIHPVIIDSYLDGTMVDIFKKRAEEQLTGEVHSLKPEEAAVLAFLQKRLAAEQKERRSTLLQKLKASIKHRKRINARP
ncbi:MAG TPA: DNA topoisomerase IB [Verrucomicrobiae bacterium]|jgi:DNA topoisomerase-1|nr:DNA topoisomerase IB [Verrucomicrobiae bacterium]